MQKTVDHWSPKEYEKFQHLRVPALDELLKLIERRKAMRVLDMGCGSADFTLAVKEVLDASFVLAVENSDSMLDVAKKRSRAIDFAHGDINTFDTNLKFDLVFSNGVLQYAMDQAGVLARFRSWLTDRGQIAVQFPMNRDTVPIACGFELAKNEPYATYCQELLEKFARNNNGLHQYAAWLHELGFKRQVVRTQAHPHFLSAGQELLDWLEQTFLNIFADVLPPEVFAQFRNDYRDEFSERIPLDRPHLYVLKRTYLWAEL